MRKIRIGINGFGRIGRQIFKEIVDHYSEQLEVVAINNPGNVENFAYLLKFDSVYGGWKTKKIRTSQSIEDEKEGVRKYLLIDDKQVRFFSETDPRNILWKKYEVDIVVESSGLFTTRESARVHLDNGVKKVLISAPAKDVKKTVVYGVNLQDLKNDDDIVSAASCTTNCLAPVLKIAHDNFKVKNGFMTTVHAATSDQRLLDSSHSDFRRGRSVFNNIIPTSTGAAKAIYSIIPEMEGRMDGVALRVMTSVGSLIDLTLNVEKECTVEEVNKIFKENADGELLSYVDKDLPIVSTDIIGRRSASIFDASLTKVINSKNGDGTTMLKLFSWYDNEISYVYQYVRLLNYMAHLLVLTIS